MKNTKTTVAGVAGALGVLCIGVAALLDNDPETVLDMQAAIGAIGTILAAFGVSLSGILAKDGDK